MHAQTGEMAERSNAAVLKTVDCHRSGGSNPSFSAKENRLVLLIGFFISQKCQKLAFKVLLGNKKTMPLKKALGFSFAQDTQLGTAKLIPFIGSYT